MHFLSLMHSRGFLGNGTKNNMDKISIPLKRNVISQVIRKPLVPHFPSHAANAVGEGSRCRLRAALPCPGLPAHPCPDTALLGLIGMSLVELSPLRTMQNPPGSR